MKNCYDKNICGSAGSICNTIEYRRSISDGSQVALGIEESKSISIKCLHMAHYPQSFNILLIGLQPQERKAIRKIQWKSVDLFLVSL